MPVLVLAERTASTEVIEHLMEIDRRRLYLDQACSSLYRYAKERLGYSEDEALKRVRVARFARQVPRVLEELRSGAMHLTGAFLLAAHLTEQNAEALLAEARGKSRRELEALLARWFPQPDVEARVDPMPAPAQPALGFSLGSSVSGPSSPNARPGTGNQPPRSKLEPLSPASYRVQFTASAEFRAKIERARELLSHAVPSGDLPALFERAIDALIERELRRRTGAGKPRKRRLQKPGSRHVPLDIARLVWERDNAQCTFVNPAGNRCSERRFLTLEHRTPYARGGPATVENLCLLCRNHNAENARRVFGERYIEQKQVQRARTSAESRESSASTASGHDQIELRESGGSQGEFGTLEIDGQCTGMKSTDCSGNPEHRPKRKAELEADLPSAREVSFAKALRALCRLGFAKRQVEKVLAELRASPLEFRMEELLRAALCLLVAPAT